MTAYDERSGYKERLEKAEAERDFYAKDAATAWEKCEERRLQAGKAEAMLAATEEGHRTLSRNYERLTARAEKAAARIAELEAALTGVREVNDELREALNQLRPRFHATLKEPDQ